MNSLLQAVIAYRPFLDPIDAQAYWWLFLLPLVVGVSIAYKAVRLPGLERFWRHVFKMTTQIIITMVVMAVGFYFIVEWIVPRM